MSTLNSISSYVEPNTKRISRHSIFWILTIYTLSALILLAFGESVNRAVVLYDETLPVSPYFIPSEALLLYIILPLTVISSLFILIFPGLGFILCRGGAENLVDWVIRSFGATFVLHFIILSIVKMASLYVLLNDHFLEVELLMGFVTLSLLYLRFRANVEIQWPIFDKTERYRIVWLLSITYLLIVLLLPMILWADMTGDGIEILEAGRSLLENITPRFPNGLMGLGTGLVSTSYPISWFVMFFGSIEASARLPIVLLFPIMVCSMIGIIELNTARRLKFSELNVIVLTLSAYILTMGYSASYNPYSADLSAQLTQETFTILCMLSGAYSFWSKRFGTFLLFMLLAYLARPTGLLFIGLLGIFSFIHFTKKRFRTLIQTGVAITLCLVTLVLYEFIYIPFINEEGVTSYPSSSLANRIRYLTLFDFSRLLYIIIPSGILPAFALLAYRWQDPIGRTLSGLSIIYFLFFFPLATISIHFFAPAMIFPIVVFWRLVLVQHSVNNQTLLKQQQKIIKQEWITITSTLFAFFAIWLSLPQSFDIYRSAREIGKKMEYRITDFSGNNLSNYQLSLNKIISLYDFFAPGWNIKDPSRELVVSPLALMYYSQDRFKTQVPINYVIQFKSDPKPFGFNLISNSETHASYVRDYEIWASDRYQYTPTNYRSSIYDLSREAQFAHIGIPKGNYTIDLKKLLTKLKFY